MQRSKMDIQAAENEGQWFTYPGSDFKIHMRSVNYQPYREAYDRLIATARRRHGGRVPEDEHNQMIMRCVADHLVLDWKGLKDGDKDVAFSVEEAFVMMRDLPKFARFIINTATNEAAFEDEADEQDAETLGKG